MLESIERVLLVVVQLISMSGYWGIAAGMLLESACIPIPSEVILPLAGNMAYSGTISFIGANIAVAAGSMLGSILAYYIGYYGGRPFILKYGKYFFISENHFYQAEKVFKRYGNAAVFFGRLLPVIRTFISLPSGIARINFGKFSFYSLLGMLPWNFMLIYLGYVFGQRYETVIRPIFKKFEFAVIGTLFLIIIFILNKMLLTAKRSV
ncbi:MAG: DedA family protein [Clostridia bacterium]|nr:DedA family protein [Clostridia bacterium]